MFERRLKLFFLLLVGVTGLLVFRAAQLQVWGADEWQKRAREGLKKQTLLETTRGSIVDVRGNVVAVDEPCMDAVVDFRAIQEDPKWIQEVALRRLNKLPEEQYRKLDRERKRQMQEEAQEQVRADLKGMWRALAQASKKSGDEIEEIKSAIRRKVLMRQRAVWHSRYSRALDVYEEKEEEAWYKRWLLSGSAAPQIDSFAIEVSEQTERHVVVGGLSNEAHNALKKRLEEFPGLDLRPGLRRFYPYGATAAHVIGTMGAVRAEDVAEDPNAKDDLRKYYLNDRMGRSGVEALGEEVLRGGRGRVVRVEGREVPEESAPPAAGRDVQLTIDILLQQEIEEAFKRVEFWRQNKETRAQELFDVAEMYGAAVVIDVASGQVRAMVSNPSFDLNEFEANWPALWRDQVNRPLTNRATQMVLVPGSTVKPIVGIGAMTQGVLRHDETIECKGYLYINGKRYDHGKCWTVATARSAGANYEHHQIPYNDPHPTGFLNFSDALQRSCNVYFETVGDRLGIEGLSVWYEKFGLGQKTGVGIAEAAGMVPRSFDGPTHLRQSISWFSSIGQSQVQATPLQMANVAATIARDGVWVRPTVVATPGVKPRPTTQPVKTRPDREDLRLSPLAVQMAKKGMFAAVNTRAGTGMQASNATVVLAGKTGSAQTKAFSYLPLGDDGKPMRNEKGELLREVLEVSLPQRANMAARWHRTSNEEGRMSHGWFIGFAPAENPRVAFAVMMEYGGGGGETAPIVKALLDACAAHGYLSASGGGR